MTAVIDTGVLYALVDAGAEPHERCVAALQAEPEAIIVPQATLPEVCSLVASNLGAQREAAFVRYLAESDWRLEPLTDVDVPRVVTLMLEHADAGLGYVNAAVAAVAERMAATRIYTLNQRAFALLHPTHVERFELLP